MRLLLLLITESHKTPDEASRLGGNSQSQQWKLTGKINFLASLLQRTQISHRNGYFASRSRVLLEGQVMQGVD